jgi:hypothetical protein
MNAGYMLQTLHPILKIRVRLLSCIALAILYAHSPAWADEAKPPKAKYAGLFTRKATESGAPIPRAPNTLALGKSRDLTIQLQKKKVCFFGDLDIILVEASWAQFDSLRVSLEPLDDSEEKGSSVVMPIKKLTAPSYSVTLKAPKVTTATPMGLFVCSDTNKSGMCRKKSLVNPNQIIKRYAPEAKPENLDPKKDILDKIYYFNHVVVEPNSISSSDGVYDKNEHQRLQGIAKLSNPRESEQNLSRINRLHTTLTSTPVQQVGNTLKVTLPISDFAHCGEQGAQ